MNKMKLIEKMRKDGYPYRIKGNGGFTAVLYDMQPLSGNDYVAIYCYPGGECCHSLNDMKYFEIIENRHAGAFAPGSISGGAIHPVPGRQLPCLNVS